MTTMISSTLQSREVESYPAAFEELLDALVHGDRDILCQSQIRRALLTFQSFVSTEKHYKPKSPKATSQYHLKLFSFQH